MYSYLASLSGHQQTFQSLTSEKVLMAHLSLIFGWLFGHHFVTIKHHLLFHFDYMVLHFIPGFVRPKAIFENTLSFFLNLYFESGWQFIRYFRPNHISIMWYCPAPDNFNYAI